MTVERNVPPGLFVQYQGDALSVTHLFDAEGEDVTDPERAYSFVAGPLPDGWLGGKVQDYPIHRAV